MDGEGSVMRRVVIECVAVLLALALAFAVEAAWRSLFSRQ